MTWMSRWKLGSMVSKWVISPTSKWGVVGGYNPFTNFWGHPSGINIGSEIKLDGTPW